MDPGNPFVVVFNRVPCVFPRVASTDWVLSTYIGK